MQRIYRALALVFVLFCGGLFIGGQTALAVEVPTGETEANIPVSLPADAPFAGADIEFSFSSGLGYLRFRAAPGIDTTVSAVANGKHYVGFFSTYNRFIPTNGSIYVGDLVFSYLGDADESVTLSMFKLHTVMALTVEAKTIYPNLVVPITRTAGDGDGDGDGDDDDGGKNDPGDDKKPGGSGNGSPGAPDPGSSGSQGAAGSGGTIIASNTDDSNPGEDLPQDKQTEAAASPTPGSTSALPSGNGAASSGSSAENSSISVEQAPLAVGVTAVDQQDDGWLALSIMLAALAVVIAMLLLFFFVWKRRNKASKAAGRESTD